MHLSGLDTAVMVMYFLLISGLGLFLSRFQKDSRSYFLADRNVPWWAACLSVVATETSVLTFIGVPAIAYSGDLKFIQLTAGYLIARILLAAFFLPAYLEQDTYTVYGYLRRRFGARVRTWSAWLFMVTQLLGSGVRLYAAALVLTTISGFESILPAILIIAVITAIYTWAGGISAVIWTDVVQAIIMVGGGIIALVILWGYFDGGAWHILTGPALAEGKLAFLDFGLALDKPYTIFSGVIGGAFLGMASHGTDQVLAQRLLTCRTLSDGRKAIVGSALIIIPQFLIFLILGTLLFYFYQAHPPAEAFANPDRIFPYFIVHNFPPGLAGLVVAAMFGAAMSTLDSGIQALSASTVIDVIRPLTGEKKAESEYLGLSRALVLVWSGILCGVAFLAGGWGPVLETGLRMASYTYGPLLGVFLLGFFSPLRRQLPVELGMLGGLAAVLAVAFFSGVAWSWYVASGAAATILIALTINAFTGKKSE